LLAQAKQPGIFLGWGAADATALSIQLAETLQAPVATTLQGLSVFPGNHPLHVGMGIGPAAVPAATQAFADCDVLLAIGTRFGEIATGSFGIKANRQLIHVDINPSVFNVNYPAQVCLPGDACQVLQALLPAVRQQQTPEHRQTVSTRANTLPKQIAQHKQAYTQEWLAHNSQQRVNPARFFQSLRQHLPDDAYVVTDDGNHTFLVAELFESRQSRHLITPTDFNCMGYCVPAAIGVQLTHPDQQVVGIVGDGAFLMTGLETLTASELGLGVVYYVFNDGELSQISQAQTLPYNRKTCTVLPTIRIKGVADACGAHYLHMGSDADIDSVIQQAQSLSRQGHPVIVDVHIDYSKPTRFTKGILSTNLQRMDLGNKLRMVGRAAWRRISPPG
jgi:acetolactate synthase-1/2/3 large subunit